MATATTKVPMSETKWGNDMIVRPLAATAQIYYPGAMIALDASGNATKCLDTAGLKFDGINREAVRIQVFSGDLAGDHTVPVGRPWRFTMAIAAAAAGDEGKAVYAVDDQTVGYTSSNAIQVGWVDQVISATVVLIRPMWAGVNGTSNFDNNTLSFTGATTVNNVTIPDNLADALHFQQGTNKYAVFVTTDGAESSQLRGPDATAVTNAGGAALLTGGVGGATSGVGGAATVAAGAGTTNSAGGVASMAGGAGAGTGAGGATSVTGGLGGATGAGGAASLVGGQGGATSGAGGAAQATGGAGQGTASVGGAFIGTGGAGSGSSAGGAGRVVGGVGGATGAGGAGVLLGGVGGATSGSGGAITITSGAAGATTGVAGAVNISCGATTSGNGPAITLTAGSGAAGTNAGGNINLIPGAAVSTGIPGEVQINSAAGLFEVNWQQFLAANAPVSGTSYGVYLANRAMRVKAVSVTCSSTATVPTVDVIKDTGTGAPGGGTSVLTGAISFNTTANTTVVGTVSTTIATITMAAGDRLSLKWGGTVGSITGAMVNILLVPV